MRLTVVGRNGSLPATGGACSGYLVSAGETHLLLDCGSGVLARLGRHLDYNRLAAVLVSHLHFDHTSDLFVLGYGIDIDLRLGLRAGPLPVHAFARPAAEWRRLRYKRALDLRPLTAADRLTVGGLELDFAPTVHSRPGVSVRVRSGGRTLVYSGDTAPQGDLTALARGADLLLCEASFARPGEIPPGTAHMSAVDAGRTARAAGARRLVVTHFHPRQDPAEHARLAAEAFGGPTEAAEPDRAYEV